MATQEAIITVTPEDTITVILMATQVVMMADIMMPEVTIIRQYMTQGVMITRQ